MPPAIDGEPGRADQVHDLIKHRSPGHLAGRNQVISEQDEDRAAPAGDLDPDLDRGQEFPRASCLST